MKTVKSREMVERKGLVLGLIILLTVVITMGYVSAVTGSIGNSRMIINAKTGDVIERTILVKNVNNISVAIEMFSSGDLASDLKIQNANFTLGPGEERKVNISIKVTKEGSTETSVNVRFTGVGEKSGVGLSSTIIINAQKGNFLDPGKSDGKGFFEQYSMIIIGSSVTLILLIIFIVLMTVSRKKKVKEMVRPKEMAKPTKPKKESSKS
jgi:hypothetical protein